MRAKKTELNHPFICPVLQTPITDPVIVNLPGVAPLIYFINKALLLI